MGLAHIAVAVLAASIVVVIAQTSAAELGGSSRVTAARQIGADLEPYLRDRTSTSQSPDSSNSINAREQAGDANGNGDSFAPAAAKGRNLQQGPGLYSSYGPASYSYHHQPAARPQMRPMVIYSSPPSSNAGYYSGNNAYASSNANSNNHYHQHQYSSGAATAGYPAQASLSPYSKAPTQYSIYELKEPGVRLPYHTAHHQVSGGSYGSAYATSSGQYPTHRHKTIITLKKAKKILGPVPIKPVYSDDHPFEDEELEEEEEAYSAPTKNYEQAYTTTTTTTPEPTTVPPVIIIEPTHRPKHVEKPDKLNKLEDKVEHKVEHKLEKLEHKAEKLAPALEVLKEEPAKLLEHKEERLEHKLEKLDPEIPKHKLGHGLEKKLEHAVEKLEHKAEKLGPALEVVKQAPAKHVLEHEPERLKHKLEQDPEVSKHKPENTEHGPEKLKDRLKDKVKDKVEHAVEKLAHRRPEKLGTTLEALKPAKPLEHKPVEPPKHELPAKLEQDPEVLREHKPKTVEHEQEKPEQEGGLRGKVAEKVDKLKHKLPKKFELATKLEQEQPDDEQDAVDPTVSEPADKANKQRVEDAAELFDSALNDDNGDPNLNDDEQETITVDPTSNGARPDKASAGLHRPGQQHDSVMSALETMVGAAKTIGDSMKTLASSVKSTMDLKDKLGKTGGVIQPGGLMANANLVGEGLAGGVRANQNPMLAALGNVNDSLKKSMSLMPTPVKATGEKMMGDLEELPDRTLLRGSSIPLMGRASNRMDSFRGGLNKTIDGVQEMSGFKP